MRFLRSLIVCTSALTLGACGDSSGPEATPTSVEIVTPAPATAPAGLALATTPTFVVKDQNGNVMGGVPVTIVVSAGGGTLASAPTVSAGGPTPVGQWTLGRTVTANSLTITAGSVAPVTLTVTSLAGAAARIVALSPTAISGTVAQGVSPLPVARVTDEFDNPVAGAAIAVALTGGGSTSAATLTSDASGDVAVPDWTLGTVKGPNTLTMVGPASVLFTATAAAGALQALAIVSGNNQTALAGTAPSSPIRLSPSDQYGNTLDGQTATFSIGAGGGAVTSFPIQADFDQLITAPVWNLGRSAVPQQLIATVAGRTATISATVLSNYVIDVRFWGSPMTPEQQALFTTAAARIRGIVVGAVPPDVAVNANVENDCGVDGVTNLNETIPGVIIYASIQNIDGSGGVLASAGPCYVRSSSDLRPSVGVMEFDVSDIAFLQSRGNLVDVITHEMLHVVGVGIFWTDKGLLRNFNTPTVEYVGAGGLQGCRLTGGTTTCASAVPVENTGGAGTANSHWRESTFVSELMTGYLNTGAMPLSIITVRSIEDLGYTINPPGSDPYFIPGGSLRQGGESALISPPAVPWEKGLGFGPIVTPRNRPSPAPTPR